MIITSLAIEELIIDIGKAARDTRTIIDDEKRAAHEYFDDPRTRRKLINLKYRALSLGFLKSRIVKIIDNSDADEFETEQLHKELTEVETESDRIKLVALVIKCLEEGREPTHYELKDIFGA